jgi:NitT/TauT family transport system substrate-binding protein
MLASGLFQPLHKLRLFAAQRGGLAASSSSREKTDGTPDSPRCAGRTVTSPGFLRRPAFLFLSGVVAMAFVAACGGSDNGGSQSATGSTGSAALEKVTLQLDWTPNTNHLGIYVALANGWYKDAGIDLEILPYGDASPDTVVANGQADVGVSFPASVIYSRAAGLPLTSIASVLQSNPTQLAVLASSDIQRPRDFDGKTYAGFGLPYEEPQIRTVIQADGGKGDFQVATLDSFAYEALYSGRADFTEMFMTWEGIEADMRGIAIRSFKYTDYGMPNFPGVILIARSDDVASGSPKLKKFLEVTQRGYTYAAEHPDDAAKLLLDYLPDAFPEPDLVTRSAEALPGYFLVSGTAWGVQNADDWHAYTKWFVDQGLITDANDKPITSIDGFPGGALFDNSLLPGS